MLDEDLLLENKFKVVTIESEDEVTMERFMEMFGSNASIKRMFSRSEPATRWEQTMAQFEKAYDFLKNAEDVQVYARMPFLMDIK